jgi:hypothetical protein
LECRAMRWPNVPKPGRAPRKRQSPAFHDDFRGALEGTRRAAIERRCARATFRVPVVESPPPADPPPPPPPMPGRSEKGGGREVECAQGMCDGVGVRDSMTTCGGKPNGEGWFVRRRSKGAWQTRSRRRIFSSTGRSRGRRGRIGTAVFQPDGRGGRWARMVKSRSNARKEDQKSGLLITRKGVITSSGPHRARPTGWWAAKGECKPPKPTFAPPVRRKAGSGVVPGGRES